jgi:RimJ/RimL family protein N-acetyltransferase
MDVLQTERLVLRPLEHADAPRLQRLAGQREIAETTLNIPHPYPTEAAVDFIQRAQELMLTGKMYTFALTLHGEGQLLGCIGLRVDTNHERGELGYWIGVPYWNKGFTTEAVRRIVRFALVELGLNRVYAVHFAENPASGRVMQKAGMTYEGTLRQHVHKWNEPRDLVQYGLLREEYLAAEA